VKVAPPPAGAPSPPRVAGHPPPRHHPPAAAPAHLDAAAPAHLAATALRPVPEQRSDPHHLTSASPRGEMRRRSTSVVQGKAATSPWGAPSPSPPPRGGISPGFEPPRSLDSRLVLAAGVLRVRPSLKKLRPLNWTGDGDQAAFCWMCTLTGSPAPRTNRPPCRQRVAKSTPVSSIRVRPRMGTLSISTLDGTTPCPAAHHPQVSVRTDAVLCPAGTCTLPSSGGIVAGGAGQARQRLHRFVGRGK